MTPQHLIKQQRTEHAMCLYRKLMNLMRYGRWTDCRHAWGGVAFEYGGKVEYLYCGRCGALTDTTGVDMEKTEKFSEWLDIVEELDAGTFDVSKKEADFLQDLLERRPAYLSSRQVDWLRDMQNKYLVF